jgi:hypothetical protein
MRGARKASVVLLVAGLLLGWQATAQAVYAPPTESWWITDGDGTWGDGINWDTATPPNGAGTIAHLERTTAARAILTLDTDVTLGTLYFRNAGGQQRYQLHSTGGQALRFNNGGAGANLIAENRHNFTAPVVIEDTLTCGTWRGGLGGIHFMTLTSNPSQGMVLTSSGLDSNFLGQATFGAGSEILLNAGNISVFQQGSIAGLSRLSLKADTSISLMDSPVGPRLSANLLEFCGGRTTFSSSGAAPRTEAFGTLSLARGSSALECWGNTGNALTVQSSGFARAAGATARMAGWELGSPAIINPAGASAFLDHGILPFATVWGDFATLGQGGTGVLPYTASTRATSTWPPWRTTSS